MQNDFFSALMEHKPLISLTWYIYSSSEFQETWFFFKQQYVSHQTWNVIQYFVRTATMHNQNTDKIASQTMKWADIILD